MLLKEIFSEFPTEKFDADSNIYLGIDPSITAPGIAYYDASNNSIHFHTVKIGKPPKEGEKLYERQRKFLKYLVDLLLKLRPGRICLENYSFNSHSSAYSLAELGGPIRMLLEDYKYTSNNSSVDLVAPTTLKKFAIGKGAGDKDLVLLNIYKRWKVECRDNNEGDAVALAFYGYDLQNGSAYSLKNIEVVRL
jgi:crossover junction endodeoxyribonuclease RuvC